MKKLMTILSSILLVIGSASAQNTKTYTGFVVDNIGNPVVGAEVMAPGGGATVITDSDGSFTIEVPVLLKKLTASYPGMAETTLNLEGSSNLVFKMKNLKKMTGFVSVIGNVGGAFNKVSGLEYGREEFTADESYFTYGGGIMGGQLGQLGNWGWYLKGMANFLNADWDEYICGILTAGAIRRISKNAHLYFGAGGSVIKYSSSAHPDSGSGAGFSIDFGSIFNLNNHLNIIAGLNYSYGKVSDVYIYDNITLNLITLSLGVGYTF